MNVKKGGGSKGGQLRFGNYGIVRLTLWQLGDNEEDAFLLKGTRPLGVL